MDADEVLKAAARESVKQGENLRSAVREITLGALRSRELTLGEIKRVVRSVTEGVSAGAASSKLDPGDVLSDALAGMDEAVLKAVEANHLALQRLAEQGQSLRDSQMRKALDQLEQLEDQFLATVKDAAKKGSRQLKDQWAAVLQRTESNGTRTADQIEATMEEFGSRMHEAMAENFTTLASGILIGMTEGLQQGKKKKG